MTHPRRSGRRKAALCAVAASLLAAERWELRLYVAGQTPRSLAALANLKDICERELPGKYRIEVIDLLVHPERARADQIVVTPTLVRKRPSLLTRIVGDLSNRVRTRIGLGLAAEA